MQYLKDQLQTIAEDAKDGMGSALEAYAKLKFCAEYAQELMEDIKEDAIEEASLYAKGDEPTFFGKRVSLESKSSYEYTFPQHLENLMQQKAQIDADLKEYKSQARKGKPMVYYDADGVEIEVTPATKKQTTSLTFRKA